MAIPYGALETLFVDAGNTLHSMDFEWISAELAARGVHLDAATVRRAEAAARPAMNTALERLRSAEATEAFAFYLGAVLAGADGTGALAETRRQAIAAELVPVLRGRGTSRLWSFVLPGVREALEMLRGAGLRLVVVSNSDGTVERSLELQGMRSYFHAVVDSHIVGFEKPDPRIFDRALELSRSDPETTLHVGDLYGVDVLGARRAGIHAVLLDPYGDWSGVDCDRVPDLLALARRILAARGAALAGLREP